MPHSRVLFLRVQNYVLRLLIDTGAEVSVIPVSSTSHPCRKAPHTSSCKQDLNILGLCLTFPWVFLVADVSYPIIEVYFLRRFQLLVDMQYKWLVDEVTSLAVHGIFCAGIRTESLYRFSLHSKCKGVLQEFPTITCVTNFNIPLKHDVTYHISTVGPHAFL